MNGVQSEGPPSNTVLIVDDEPQNLDLLNEILRHEFRVLAANNGERALRIAKTPPYPSAILLDIMMPKMDGYEVLRHLQECPETKGIPVIFVTAMGGVADETRGLTLGAVDYITKPVKPAIVLARLRTQIELKRARDILADEVQWLETEVERRTQQNMELQRELQQSQKMDALGNFAGGIAHDLNNLLQPMLGLTKIMYDRAEVGSRDAERLKHVLDAATRARDLVGSIKLYARQESPETKVCDLSVIVDETLTLAASLVPKGIALRAESVEKGAWIEVNATQIETVLLNLISNARDAIEGGSGEIVVGVSVENMVGDIPHPILKPSQTETPFARLSVRDDGTGVSPDQMEKIFDPFNTTKAPGEGTGLGLSMVYGIVKQYGGGIGVESVVGEGSTFHLYFPMTAREEE